MIRLCSTLLLLSFSLIYIFAVFSRHDFYKRSLMRDALQADFPKYKPRPTVLCSALKAVLFWYRIKYLGKWQLFSILLIYFNNVTRSRGKIDHKRWTHITIIVTDNWRAARHRWWYNCTGRIVAICIYTVHILLSTNDNEEYLLPVIAILR